MAVLFPAGDLFGPESLPPAPRPLPFFGQPEVKLDRSMSHLRSLLLPMVEAWRKTEALELEARLVPLVDGVGGGNGGGVTESTFKVVLDYLFGLTLRGKLNLKKGARTNTPPGFDDKYKFTTSLDQFYAIPGSADRIRQTIDIDGKITEVVVKTSQDTIDATITPVHLPANAPSHVPRAGLHVRFSTKQERRIVALTEPSSPVVSARSKERISFLTPRGDFSIDCTLVRSGVDAADAARQDVQYEIEVEALRVPGIVHKVTATGLVEFVDMFLFKCLSVVFGFTPLQAHCDINKVEMRSTTTATPPTRKRAPKEEATPSAGAATSPSPLYPVAKKKKKDTIGM